ncbi:MTMR14 isoform 10 [Pan troglodytes]|uniref:Myotubularin related protein 14 n=2 Tax=Homininae TaxID=207598 RepID=F8WBT3_HUMAN|nr:MTMR14 isoform 10 [Pan troglodytes]
MSHCAWPETELELDVGEPVKEPLADLTRKGLRVPYR